MRHFQIPTDHVRCLRFSLDGRSLHSLSKDSGQAWGHFHRAQSIDIHSGALIRERNLGPCGSAIFSPGLESIYYDSGGDYLTEIHKTDVRTGRDEILLRRDFIYVVSLAITPNEHLLALGGLERGDSGTVYSVRRLDVIHKTLLDPVRTIATHLDFSPGGQLLAVGGQLREEFRAEGPSSGIRIWSGKRLIEEFSPSANHLLWSPDGRLAWGAGQQLNLARPGNGEPIRSWCGSSGDLLALRFSPDNRLLLTGTDNGLCALHDSAQGEMRVAFDWGIGPIHSVAFSPDGLTCAAGGENGQIAVWDVDE
jgi:WD40 repeat protein